MKEKKKNKFCKKFEIRCGYNYDQPKILYGIIIKEDNFFYWIKTARRIHQVNKSQIIDISDTNKIFRNGEYNG